MRINGFLLFFLPAWGLISQTPDPVLPDSIWIQDYQDLLSNGEYGTEYLLKPGSNGYDLIRLKRWCEIKDKELRKSMDCETDTTAVVVSMIPTNDIRKLLAAIAPAACSSATDALRQSVAVDEARIQRLRQQAKGKDTLAMAEINHCRVKLDQPDEQRRLVDHTLNLRVRGDYPRMRLRIHFGDRVSRMESRSAAPFMLPWVMDDSSLCHSLEVSRQLAAWLESGSLSNTDRLAGKDFDYIYTKFWFERCQILSMEARELSAYEGVIVRATKLFPHVRAQVDRASTPALEKRCLKLSFDTGSYCRVAFLTKDFRPDSMPSLVFEQAAALDMLLSIGWFVDRIERNQATVEIQRADLASMTPRAIRFFKEEGGLFLKANKIEADIEKATLLQVFEEEGKSNWIMLPDSRIILWNYTGNKVLGFSDADLGIPDSWKRSYKSICRFMSDSGKSFR